MESFLYLILAVCAMSASVCLLPENRKKTRFGGVFLSFVCTMVWIWQTGAFHGCASFMSAIAGGLFVWIVFFLVIMVLSAVIAFCVYEIQILKQYFYGKHD